MDAKKTRGEQYKSILDDPLSISSIDNPDIILQMLAVRLNHRSIFYIHNPLSCAYLYVIQTNPSIISEMDDLSLSTQMLAVERDGLLIRHIENPSAIIQLLAVQENPESIKYINNPSRGIINTARSRSSQKGVFFRNWFEEKFTTCPLKLATMI